MSEEDEYAEGYYDGFVAAKERVIALLSRYPTLRTILVPAVQEMHPNVTDEWEKQG